MPRFTTRDAADLYHVDGWGDEYFSVNKAGHLAVTPMGPKGSKADLYEMVKQLRTEGHELPIVLRFPQILEHRVTRLHNAFRAALRDNDVKDVRYRGVFPIKVNQRQEVVQELAKRGRKYQYGLEVGSKAELLAALAMDPNRKSLLVVNGFKDKEFLEAACLATHLKEEVVIVLDEVGELPHILPLLDQGTKPIIGLRLKLRSKAPGKWALSGGEKSKFGLTIPEVLWAVEELKKAGHLDRLQLLHFHIGSQISNIRRIAQGVREAARLHAELVKMGVPLRMLDVGGGQAVDYDGSGSSGTNSANYNMEEYASTVVFTIKDVCEESGIPMPDIISESGRAVVSHHAVLIVNVLRRVPYLLPDQELEPRLEEDPSPVWNLYDLWHNLGPKNVFETFHDAIQYRDDVYNLFDLGHLNLPTLGRAETVMRSLFARIRTMLESQDERETEEYLHCRGLLGQKLVCNFSMFQSLPDVWGVKQQFPIVPLHRLQEEPSEVATLADITCDSDGEIRQYIDAFGTRPELEVHALREGEPYYLAVPMVGAYQDALGDYHNLFGETAEAWVTLDEKGWHVEAQTQGSRVADMLRWVNYNPSDVKKRLRSRIKRLHTGGRLAESEADAVAERLAELISGSTYLQST